jgi:uncharacterized protein YndB with AHSA1/START domain
MSEPSTRTSGVVPAAPDRVWRAFMDPDEMLAWLPPARMTGLIHRFDPRVGGGYDISLYYPQAERTHRGKTSAKEDRVHVRFVALDEPHRIVQAVTFESDDPAFAGEMKITILLEPAADGTRVDMLHENLPPGLRPEDDAEGSRISLDQLRRYLSES